MSNQRKNKKKQILPIIPFIVLGLALVAVVVAIMKFKDDTALAESSDISGVVDASESSSETLTPLTATDDEIYNVDQMTADGVEALDASQYADMAAVIEETMADFGVSAEDISLVYTNLQTNETYTVNEDSYMTAASTVKVPLATVIIDAIEAGDMTWESPVTYAYEDYEEGDGTITAAVASGTGQATYTIEELMGESLMHSDNTATNMLIDYYETVYGEGAFRSNIVAEVYDQVGYIDEAIYEDNIASANFLTAYYKLISTNEIYQPILDFLLQTSPDRLFTTYVKSSVMANKYGNYATALNDTGIYYENDEAQYSLVVYTDGLTEGEDFLANLNLRVNEYYRATYGE
jgi:hypothetical protein